MHMNMIVGGTASGGTSGLGHRLIHMPHRLNTAGWAYEAADVGVSPAPRAMRRLDRANARSR